MRILFDTNVVLDIILKREPFVRDANQIVQFVGNTMSDELLLTSLSVTNIVYIARKKIGNNMYSLLNDLCVVFSIVNVDSSVIHSAILRRWKDFEDAVQYEAAIHSKADCIVTRNIKDFEDREGVVILSPEEFVSKYCNN